MAKELVYDVKMKTKDAEKGLDKVKQKTKDISKEEKKAGDKRKQLAAQQKAQQKEAIGQMGLFGVTVNGLKASFKGAMATSKLLFASVKTGLIATGIGIFLVALGSLVAYFNSSKVAAEKLEVIMTTVGAAFTVLTERFAKFGGAILKLMTGDLKGAANDMKETFSGIGAEIKADVIAMNELSKAAIDLRNAERDINVELAERRAETAALKLIAEDVTKSTEVRLKAAEEAFRIENELLDKRVANAEEALRIQLETMAVGENTEEDLNREAELRIALANIQEESAGKQLEINNKINTIRKEGLLILDQEKKAEELKLDEAKKKEEADALATEKEKERKQKEADDLLAIEEKRVADAKLIQDAEILSREEANKKAGVTILGQMSQIAGEGTKLGKATAMSGMLIDTATGISASISNATKSAQLAGPGAAIVTPVLIAQLIGQVLSGIGSARAILGKVKGPTPPAPPTPSPSGGGSGGGAIPTFDASSLIPNMQEINEVAPVQAYVVENDITNKQTLQSELEFQTTL